jgi:hypothetical protein
MCYDKETSLKTFALAVAVCTALWYRNYPGDRVIAVMWPAVMSMQLAEYFMWDDQKCGLKNKYATVASAIILALQPVFIIAAVRYWGKSWIRNNALTGLLVLLSVCAVIYAIRCLFYARNHNLCSKPGALGHLEWDLDGLYKNTRGISQTIIHGFYFFAFAFLITIKPTKLAILYTAICYLSLFYAIKITEGKESQWKSQWCWIANLLTIIPLLSGYLNKNKIFPF